MKNKIKVYIKKIKNWLSSLCKWAKKHIIKIITALIALVIMLAPFFHSEKTSANAQSSLLSSKPLILLPSTPVLITNLDKTVYVCNSWLGYYNETLCIYYVQSDTAQVDTYHFERTNLWSNGGYNYCNLMYVDVHDSNAYYYYMSSPDGSSSGRSSRVALLVAEAYSDVFNYDYLINNAVSLKVTYDGNNSPQALDYDFYNSNSDLICTVRFLYLYDFADVSTITFPVTFSSSDITDSEAYSIYYADGYSTGYNAGYVAGLTDTGNYSPISILVSGITSFVNAPIFGHFSIGDLMGIAMGCILFGFAVKMFLGG